MSHCVLLVDDDPAFARLIVGQLVAEGWTVLHTTTAAEARRVIAERHPDIALLDLGLPDADGLDLCRQLRSDASTRELPIIIVTGRACEGDPIVGLDAGADDYLAKPFSVAELKARIRSVLRRVPHRSPTCLVHGPVAIDPASRTVSVAGKDVPLRAREFDLLLHLAKEPGRVWRREELLEAIWGFEHASDMVTRTVDVHVRRLRIKLAEAGAWLETVKRVGYRFNPPARPL